MTRRSLPILLAAALLALAPALLAQPPGGPGGGPFAGPRAPGGSGERLAEFLELTADQREQWDALHQDLRDEIRPLFEQQRTLAEQLRSLLDATSPDPVEVGSLVIQQRDTRRAIQAAHEQLQEQLKAILTAEQLDRFEGFQAARPPGRRGPHRRGGPGFGARG